MSEQATATIGHNSLLAIYAEQNAALPGYLLQEHDLLISRAADLKNDTDAAPQTIDTDELEREATELGGKLAKFIKEIAAARKASKEPVAAGVAIVDSFFNRILPPIENAKVIVERRVNAYKDVKRAAAGRERQEAERIAREKAAEARRLQEEANRRADEEARLRQESAMPADQDAAYEDRAAAQREATTAAVEAHEAQARATVAKAAPQTTVKAESGAASIQRTTWTGEIEDLETLDLEPLRHIITRAALDAAVRVYAVQFKDTRPLAGAKIYAKTSTAFRG